MLEEKWPKGLFVSIPSLPFSTDLWDTTCMVGNLSSLKTPQPLSAKGRVTIVWEQKKKLVKKKIESSIINQ